MEATFIGLPKDVKKISKEFAKIKGITLSEYIRSLVVADLDKRSIFTDKFKRVEENKE